MDTSTSDRARCDTHFSEAQRFSQKYFLKQTLISGKMNTIAYGLNKMTRKKVIIKAVYKVVPCKLKEVAILKQLQHIPGVIKYYDHYAIKCNIHFIVMEYFGQMNLEFFLSVNGFVSENLARMYFKQLFTTVYACFKNNILHKTLTTSNIRIDVKTNQLKIANFSTASQFDSEEEEEFISQLNSKNAPPEYFQSKKYTADGLYVWSLGLILYELLLNKKPFHSTHDIINTPLIITPHKQKLSLDVITFLNWLLAKSYRITLQQIAHHPWITEVWI